MLVITTVLSGVSEMYSQQPYIAEQQRQMLSPPLLPVITEPVLPEGWGAGPYSLKKTITVFDTWKPAHVVLAHLPAGSSVTLISGLIEVGKPDSIEVTSSIPLLFLIRGDRLLRYTQRGEGNADFWAKGRWYTNGDFGWVKNADGSGCQSDCKAQEEEPGLSTWWFKIRLPDGRLGWTESLDSPNLY